ncbi:MAG: cobalamin-dependent protein [Candidatus Izimaplasma sp.]|nr:cobalamin-dependent protein [Candidatus Izimaplasma bacterium]
MGLLNNNLSSTFNKVANNVYNQHFIKDKKLEEEYDDYRKKKMYEDILYNLSFLEVSYNLEEENLFLEYAKWLYELMMYLMPDLSKERIKEHMILHYELLSQELKKVLSDEEFKVIHHLLSNAIEITKTYKIENKLSDFNKGEYGYIRETYLNYLLEEKPSKAIDYILEIEKTKIPLEDIYVNILQKVMTEIGERWQKNIISVDQEHYMTSITQMVLSQFYQKIFSTTKNGFKLVACSVGSELHEMGARMISDLFEYNGWDSIYLGAGLPRKAILNKVENTNPDLIILSVTMPQHLSECKAIVEELNKLDKKTKIAVGGRAFKMTNQVWKKWKVDISTDNAKELLVWSEKVFKHG